MEVEISPHEKLEGRDCEAAARLARLAFDDFYSLFTRDEATILGALRIQLESFSELNSGLAGRASGELVALASMYPAGEMQLRQMEGLRSLLAISGDPVRCGKAVREFSRQFPAPSHDCLYVSRFVVAPEFRGRGLAERLLRGVDECAASKNLPAIELHVKSDNARALRFYERSGFRPTGGTGRGYLLLRRASALIKAK